MKVYNVSLVLRGSVRTYCFAFLHSKCRLTILLSCNPQVHHDYIPHQRERQCGPRLLTFFLYLSVSLILLGFLLLCFSSS